MKNEWNIELDGYGLIRISEELINKLINYRQIQANKPESGGVLIGKYLNSNGVLLIDNYTPPQPSDKQSRYEYYRSNVHTKIVQKVWLETNHESTYVGLWHTHAEAIPNYSHVDKKDWLTALNKSKFDGVNLFFFIIGQTHIRCWMGTKKFPKNKIELIGELNINVE